MVQEGVIIWCYIVATGFFAALAISYLAYRQKMLTLSGMIAATIVGGIIFGFGLWEASLLLLFFFLSGSLLGRLNRKKGERRTWKQVVCNGIVPALSVIVIALRHDLREEITLLFLGSLATATADTWATEIGMRFGKNTYNIFTFRKTTKGVSGGVSLAGFLGSLAGAFSIAALSFVRFYDTDPLCGLVLVKVLPVITLAGFLGAFIDSIVGATIQAKYTLPDGNIAEASSEGAIHLSGIRFIGNNATNLIATLWGGILAIWLGATM